MPSNLQNMSGGARRDGYEWQPMNEDYFQRFGGLGRLYGAFGFAAAGEVVRRMALGT